MPSSEEPAHRPHPGALAALRTLLDAGPGRVHLLGEVPALVGPDLHLPPMAPDAAWCHAAVAHAAAHGRHSRLALPRQRFTPITQALIGALEDARVERRAMAEFPGLARWWLPRHRAEASWGETFEALLARLGRALVDPTYHDDHPWIRKGLDLFGAPDLQEGDGEALGRIAARLGHDIGQMRLPFNDRLYRVSPSYRDDHRWMWLPTPNSTIEQESPPPPADPGSAADAPEPRAEDLVLRLPEWDHRISRHRPAWCTLRVRRAPAGDAPPLAEGGPSQALGIACRRRLRQDRRPRRRQREGDDLDLDALVDHAIAQRRRAPDDGHVHLDRRPAPGVASLLVLVDASTSTAQRELPAAEHPLLTTILASGLDLLGAWRRAGGSGALHAFRSHGRHAVDIQVVAEAADPLGFPGIQPAGSTRLGAALRYATRTLAGQRGHRWIVVITDGHPHDIDVHDPRYLVEDAREAARAARRQGITLQALVVGPQRHTPNVRRGLTHLFGQGGWTSLAEPTDLARALGRLP